MSQRWLPVTNTSASPVPPYGVMEFAGVDAATGYLQVRQPTVSGESAVLFNGPGLIPGNGGTGQGTMSWSVIAAYSGADPALGATLGVVAGSWLLSAAQAGFQCIGGGSGGYCNLVPAGGGQAPERVNLQTGTSYTYAAADFGKLVSHANAAAIAGTLPQAGTAGFPAGWWMDVEDTGAGTLTITPATSTIDGAASLAVATNQGCRICSNGTNYYTQRGMGGITSVLGTNPIQVVTAGGVATVSVLDASASQDGTVSTGTQHFGGPKVFNNGITVGNGTGLTGDNSIIFSPLVDSDRLYASLVSVGGIGHSASLQWSVGGGTHTGDVTFLVSMYPVGYGGITRPNLSIGNVSNTQGRPDVFIADDGGTFHAGLTGTGGGGDTFYSGICTAAGSGSASSVTVNTTTISGGTDGNFLYQGSGKLQEYTPSAADAAIGTAVGAIADGTY